MTRYLLLSVFLFLTFYTRAQEISELERRNGFKDIKLGMKIDTLKGCQFKKDLKVHEEFPVKLYAVENPEYSKIGEVKIDRIEIITYKDLIYEITVITDKDTRLMKALESIYGLAEYDVKKETYFWSVPGILLRFRSHSKTKLEMIYTCHKIFHMMKEDKGKKVQDIADDF